MASPHVLRPLTMTVDMNPKRNARTIELVRRFAGSDSAAAGVQQVGPSPILVHYDDLARMVQPWYDLSFALKKDPAADAEFGWMLEMWGYSIGAGASPLYPRCRTQAGSPLPAVSGRRTFRNLRAALCPPPLRPFASEDAHMNTFATASLMRHVCVDRRLAAPRSRRRGHAPSVGKFSA
jgi:hypothetical protein